MAETVEKRLEDMVPELEQMERVGLFTNKQIRNILQKRKNFEYKLRRQTKRKEDILAYIQYETNLLTLVRKRRNETHYHLKREEIDYKIDARVHNLFRLAHMRFGDDVNLWLSHFAYCKQRRQFRAASRLLTAMLKVHSNKPELWVYAAKFEFDDGNEESARGILQRGLRFNPKSKKLWLEYFRFELLFAEKMRKRQDVLKSGQDLEDEITDDIIKGEVAYVAYKQAKMDIPDDVKFLVSFLPICKKFDFAVDIEEKIFIDLKEHYPNSPLTWNALARRRLDRHQGTFPDGKNPEKEFHRVFEAGVLAAPTDETWSLYLTGCFKLIEETASEKQKDKKRQRALLVLEEAKSVGHLTKHFWIKWIDLLLELGMMDQAVKVSLESTQAHPDELDLWQKLLTLQISQEASFNHLKQILKNAGEQIPKKELWPLMRTVLEFCICSCDSKDTVNLLESLLNDNFELSSPAKEIYLEYEYLSNGIAPARNLYTRISQSPPVPVSFYNKYINIEESQPKRDMNNIRRAFEDALLHHGKRNPDLWLDYIKAETTYGKPEKAGSINMRAVKTLEGNHNQEFVSQFTLMQNTGRI